MNEPTFPTPPGPDDAREPDEARKLEHALTALRPSVGLIDRDRVMFLAGRATAEREMAQQGIAECGLAASAVAASGVVGLGLAGRIFPERGGVFSQWLWPSATAVATVGASVLGLLLAISHHPLVIREKVYVHAEPTTPAMPRNSGQPEFPAVPPGAAITAASPLGVPGIAQLPGYSVEVPVRSREERDGASIDFAPRTSLPPPNYVHNRQVALSLGVEALGSWTPSGGERHSVAYRELLDVMVSGAESQ